MHQLSITFYVILNSFLITNVFCGKTVIEDYEEFTRCWKTYPHVDVQAAETFSDLPLEIRDYVNILPGSKYWYVQNFTNVGFHIYPREDVNCYNFGNTTVVNITMNFFVMHCSLFSSGFDEAVSKNSKPGRFEKTSLIRLDTVKFLHGKPFYVQGGLKRNYIVMDNIGVSWNSEYTDSTTENYGTEDYDYTTTDPGVCRSNNIPSSPQHEKNRNAENPTVEIKIDKPFTGPNGIAPLITYTQCGGVINARSDVADTIEYKYTQNYSSNELCVWTIRNTDATSFVFYKYPTEFENTMDFIQISTFQKDRYYEPYETIVLGSSTSSAEEVTMTGAVAFVVFSTDEFIQNSGFKLMIYTICPPSYGYSYTDLFSGLTTGRLTLRSYFSNMMSTFVVSPKIATTVSLEYETMTSLDGISVFKLERSEYNEYWSGETGAKITYGFTGRNFFDGVQRYSLCTNPYPSAMIFIFSADYSAAENGTHIYW